MEEGMPRGEVFAGREEWGTERREELASRCFEEMRLEKLIARREEWGMLRQRSGTAFEERGTRLAGAVGFFEN
jgi:hypothetical protein